MKRYKVVTYLPKDQSEQIIASLQTKEINRLGCCSNCMSMCEVTSFWTSLDNAKPFLGEAGKSSKEIEVRLEFAVTEKELHSAVKAIKDVHPYEEPEIDVFEVMYGSDYLKEHEK